MIIHNELEKNFCIINYSNWNNITVELGDFDNGEMDLDEDTIGFLNGDDFYV